MICLLGVDGVGKTTVLEAAGARCLAVRTPQFHRWATFSQASLAERLDRLSQDFDRSGDDRNKALTLFLSFLLYGPAAREALACAGERVVLIERHPWTDILVYADFYLKVLTATSQVPSAESLRSPFEELKDLGLLPSTLAFLDLPGWLLRSLAGDVSQRGAFLRAHLPAPRPEACWLLTAPPEVLAQRLTMKASAREAHENVDLLIHMQDGLRQAAAALGFAPKEISTAAASPSEIIDRILASRFPMKPVDGAGPQA